MKVCFVIGSLKYSGAEKVLGIICQELKIKEHDISVVLLEKEEGSIDVIDGIKTYGAKSVGGRLTRILKRFGKIRKCIKMICPDIIVSFGTVCNVNVVPSIIGMKVPLVLCERNDPRFDPRSRLERIIRSFLYLFANGFVFQTEEIKTYFPKLVQKKAIIIENPIVPSARIWNYSESKKSIVTVARLDNYQKDQVSLLSAFAIFSKLYPEYTLDIYGDGPDEELYRNYIHKLNLDGRAILHGKSGDPLDVILKSEMFILTSRYEGMPNALMEAMSIGMPCISTDCSGGGARFLLESCCCGILVPVGGVEQIAGAMIDFARDNRKEISNGKKALQINVLLDKKRIGEKWECYLMSKRKG